jgi:hypothetical protein
MTENKTVVTHVYDYGCRFCSYCRCLNWGDVCFNILGACLAFWALLGTILGGWAIIKVAVPFLLGVK